MENDYYEIAQFCKKHWSAQVKETIEFADAVCENRFIFDRPLDLERTNEAVTFPNEIDWYYMHGSDREFLFQLNRHYFLISLGQAYYLTGDSKYLYHFVRLMTDWITRVPRVVQENSPWRSLEVGLRGDYWTKAMAYIEDTEFDTPALRKMYERSLSEHSEILRRTHGARYKLSNWGVIQDSGLFAIAAHTANEADIQLSIERLTEQSELQIMSDGVQWEQSCTYHAEVLSCFLNVMRIAENHRITLPEKFIENVNKMATAHAMWAKPNRRQPLFGDSDDNSVCDLLTSASLLLNRPDLRFFGYPVLDFESAWLFGKVQREKYENMKITKPNFTDVMLQDSGSYILRTGWSEEDDYLCMHNGFTGGGHAHADKLHIDLMLSGRDVLVDAGRYTYVPGKARTSFKGAKGHNTAVIDGKSFMKISGWNYLTHAPSIQYPVFQSGDCALIGGAHLGYFKGLGCVIPERRVLRVCKGLYVIIDSFYAGSLHRYNQYFHFSPDGEILLKNNTAEYSDGVITARAHFFAKGMKSTEIPSEYSPWYNTKVTNSAVRTSFWGFGDTYAVTVIYGGKAEKFKEYDIKLTDVLNIDNGKRNSNAKGIVIKTPEHTYTVCLSFKELTQPYVCGDVIASGIFSVFCDDEKIFNKW